jgi:hypothetical protein
LANEDRRFDNEHTAGPYYPNVIPMRRIRIRAAWNGTTYDIFNGYVSRWTQQYQPPAAATCLVEAADAFKVFANSELLTSPYAEEVDADDPSIWFRLGDTAVSNVAVDTIAGVLELAPIGSPSFGVESLAVNEPDGSIGFPTINDALQGVFPENTFPWTTAGSVEFLYRAGTNSVWYAPRAAIVSLGTNPTGFETIQEFDNRLRVILYNSAGTTFDVSTTGVNFADMALHHVVLRWEAGQNIKIYVDGVDRTASAVAFSGTMASTAKWVVAVNGLDYPPFPVAQGVVSTWDELAIYTTVIDATRVAAHQAAAITAWRDDRSGPRISRILDAVNWPAADRTIDTGMATLQSATIGGSVLEALQRIEKTEQGRLFVTAAGKVRFLARDTLLRAPYTTSQATFGDSGSELEYGDLTYDDSDESIINEAQVSRQDGAVQVVRDLSSQSKYLRRSLVLSGLEHQADSTSRDLAHWIVAHYAEPFRRATDLVLEPSAGNETTHFPHVLGRELAERVTVRRRPQSVGAAIDQDVLIEGITHEVSAVSWVTTWNLSPAETEIYWVLGVAGFSELGVTSRLGF